MNRQPGPEILGAPWETCGQRQQCPGHLLCKSRQRRDSWRLRILAFGGLQVASPEQQNSSSIVKSPLLKLQARLYSRSSGVTHLSQNHCAACQAILMFNKVSKRAHVLRKGLYCLSSQVNVIERFLWKADYEESVCPMKSAFL